MLETVRVLIFIDHNEAKLSTQDRSYLFVLCHRKEVEQEIIVVEQTVGSFILVVSSDHFRDPRGLFHELRVIFENDVLERCTRVDRCAVHRVERSLLGKPFLEFRYIEATAHHIHHVFCVGLVHDRRY